MGKRCHLSESWSSKGHIIVNPSNKKRSKMNTNKDFDFLVGWLRSNSISLEEIVKICAKVQSWLKLKTWIEKVIKKIFDTTWISVIHLLEQLYQEGHSYAEQLQFELLDIPYPGIRNSLIDAFMEKNDFSLITETEGQKIIVAFTFPFDTRETLEDLSKYLLRLKSLKPGAHTHSKLYKKKYKWQREKGYLYEILSDKLDDFDFKIVDFFKEVFQWYPEESEAFSGGKKVKITFTNHLWESFSQEYDNTDDVVTLYECVQSTEQKLTQLVEKDKRGYNYVIEILG